jgi:hypothetical protein
VTSDTNTKDPKTLLEEVSDPELRAILGDLGKTIAKDTRLRARASQDLRPTRYVGRMQLCAECVRLESLEPTGRVLSEAQPGTCLCRFHEELEAKKRAARVEAARAEDEKQTRAKYPRAPGSPSWQKTRRSDRY